MPIANPIVYNIDGSSGKVLTLSYWDETNKLVRILPLRDLAFLRIGTDKLRIVGASFDVTFKKSTRFRGENYGETISMDELSFQILLELIGF